MMLDREYEHGFDDQWAEQLPEVAPKRQLVEHEGGTTEVDEGVVGDLEAWNVRKGGAQGRQVDVLHIPELDSKKATTLQEPGMQGQVRGH